MPEGDTIFKIAAYLRRHLLGASLVGGRVSGYPDWELAGRRVTHVDCQGKHLWLTLDDEHSLRTHLGMWGTWHHYARGEEWRKPRARATVELHTRGSVYVCFNSRDVERVRAGSLRDRTRRAQLGPDLIQHDDRNDEAIARARDLLDPDAPLIDVLLDQRVAAGIGNVYKSEVLFLEGQSPFRPLGTTPDAVLDRLFTTATRLLRANVGPGARITRGAEPEGAGRSLADESPSGTTAESAAAPPARPAHDEYLWVYGRGGLACGRCDTPIAFARRGRDWRDTYWCPRCQNAPSSPESALRRS